MVGHARSWPWCCFSHVYSLETWGLLLLGCFCWPAVRAVAGLTYPLVARAAVLCCCRCCCENGAAHYGGRSWLCYAGSAAAAGPCSLHCTALAWTLRDAGACF